MTEVEWLNNATVRERVFAKVKIDESGCWVWIGHKNSKGYGRYQFTGGRALGAHRMVYAFHHGYMPTLDLDHLCRNHCCCNPDHLEPVTKRVNTLRGIGAPAINTQKTHCDHGHPFEGDNLKIITGRSGLPERRCRRCHADRQKQYKARKRAERIQ